jgi:hypothetical protein
MAITTSELLDSIASELQISHDTVIEQGLRALLEQRLQEINSDIFALHGKYQVDSVHEMEARYEAGTLEEVGSWQDFQDLDTLEYKRKRLRQLLEQMP